MDKDVVQYSGPTEFEPIVQELYQGCVGWYERTNPSITVFTGHTGFLSSLAEEVGLAKCLKEAKVVHTMFEFPHDRFPTFRLIIEEHLAQYLV